MSSQQGQLAYDGSAQWADSLRSIGDDETEVAALVALAGLPHLAPGRFRAMLCDHSPVELWQRIAAGDPPRSGRKRDAAHTWVRWASGVDPGALLAQHRAQEVRPSWFGSSHYPAVLLDDPDPPVVLFEAGSRPQAGAATIGIVGTRGCSRYGRQVAHELGARLATAGVAVASGLAHGIDAAAHAGALRRNGHAIAMVAGGVDVIYPVGNRQLWAKVLENGSIMSEYPLGARPLTWRFPARNRLIAALSAMVIVVESPVKGGSMYTVDEALRRDRVVAAVPGSIYSDASAGTNRLIADGAVSLHSIDDLIEMLPPDIAGAVSVLEPASAAPSVPVSWLLPFIGFDPIAVDVVALESKRPPGDVALEIEKLVAAGIVHRSGATIERVR